MRWLIDGYNVMHAGGRLWAKLGRAGFARARRQFLDELADAMGPDRVARTTVVFDASAPPRDFPVETTYRGLHLVFALEDEEADDRIERMIGQDPQPKALTVVSSDRRIRQAAARRRARPLTAGEFWEWVDGLRAQAAAARRPRPGAPPQTPPSDLREPATPAERDRWLETFRGVVEDPGVRDALAPDAALLTDAEIAEIQRQVDREA